MQISARQGQGGMMMGMMGDKEGVKPGPKNPAHDHRKIQK
jgi:hypothetical protein